jgi:prevent-host-death family protein
MAERVGVRELRQNLSRYLERVKAGESLTVTEHGREVARLVPSGGVDPVYSELAERFGATVPTESLEAVIDRMDAEAAPAGTTDAWLAESRRDDIA